MGGLTSQAWHLGGGSESGVPGQVVTPRRAPGTPKSADFRKKVEIFAFLGLNRDPGRRGGPDFRRFFEKCPKKCQKVDFPGKVPILPFLGGSQPEILPENRGLEGVPGGGPGRGSQEGVPEGVWEGGPRPGQEGGPRRAKKWPREAKKWSPGGLGGGSGGPGEGGQEALGRGVRSPP